MFKQRDNGYHPPMTVDLSGGGATTSAGVFGEVGMGSIASPFLNGPAVVAGSRKRGRDIRGLDRFRTFVYGEDGFRRLHAMVARNPVLMYPPDGIEAARARVMVRKAELQSQLQSALDHREHNRNSADDGDDDVFALFEARRRAESDAHPATEGEEVPRQSASEHAPPPSSLASIRQGEELATYHHKQLDSYLRLLYEFNHATFVKLPMEDTLRLLSRCGKEAVAHIVEYETQVRLRRQSRIRDLNELRQEQAALEERRLAIEDAEQARLVRSAELRQAELDLELDNGVVKAEQPDDGSADEDVKVILETTAPSVHFASLPAGDSPEENIDGIVMAVEDEGQIFLYISNGRTLWVPRHTASPTETKPVCMLNYVTPMELSRSFYLFDYAVQVVENAQMAAMNPNAKTPNEVLAAVNDFRRVCAEDQNFLLQRCYNSPAQHQQQQQQQQQQQPQQVNAYPTPYSSSPAQQQQLMMSSATASGYGGGSNNAGATGGMDSAALLTQLLQQQRQQSRMISSGNTSGQGYQDNGAGGAYGYNTNDGRNYYGGDRGRGDRRMHGNAYGNSMGYSQNMMMQGGMPRPQQPMMMGYNSMNPYGMDQMMMYGGGPGQMYPNARGGSGRRSNNYGDPMMMMGQQPGMYGSRRGMGSHSQSQQQSRMGATVRNEPEPINLDGVTVPEEIKTVYMNPAQQLVIATMPGPHMTVWLREHPFPTDLQDKKFVFGKKGICLMLKASFEEVKGSKPVELFPKQICTHFFIYGYCSRPNCFHEHHNEDQLRELIAARHVQLKAMTKAQRHQLIDEIEQKEKDGLAAAAAHREEREKKRAEAAAEREARRQQRQQQLSQQGQMYTSSSAPNTQPNPSQDIGSDNEDDDAATQGGAGSSQQQPSANASLANMMANSPSQDHQAVSAGAGEATAEASKTPVKSDVAAKLGITDSDDGDDNDGSSSSASGSSSTSNTKAKADVVEASAADEDEGDAEEEHDDAEDEEQQEEEEEEDAKVKKSKAKKPAPKKRGRAAVPKKTTKRAKKQ